MIHLKDSSVNASGLTKEMYFAAAIVECAFAKYGLEAVITSAADSTHNTNSLHDVNIGRAFDVRADFPHDGDQIVAEIKKRLDHRGFDVVDERRKPVGKVWTGPHLHIEFDPKEGEQFWA